jgi:hypothetical protein
MKKETLVRTLVSMLFGAMLMGSVWYYNTTVTSYSQAMSILSAYGKVDIEAGVFTYTSAEREFVENELKAIAKLSEVYDIVYVKSAMPQ